MDMGGVTTVMVQNIPTKLGDQDLEDLLEEVGLSGDFDFVSIPRTRRSNLGYAFVNFRTAGAAENCRRTLDGRHLGGAAHKVCRVVPAHLQGCTHSMLKKSTVEKPTDTKAPSTAASTTAPSKPSLPSTPSTHSPPSSVCDDSPRYVQSKLGEWPQTSASAQQSGPRFIRPRMGASVDQSLDCASTWPNLYQGHLVNQDSMTTAGPMFQVCLNNALPAHLQSAGLPVVSRFSF